MKKLFKTLNVVIGLPILYLLINMFVELIFIFINIASNTIDNIEVINLMVFISNSIMLLILYSIFIPNKKTLIKFFEFKNIKLKNIVYIIFLSIGMGLISSFLIGLLNQLSNNYDNVVNSITIANKSFFQLIIVILFSPIFEEIFYRGIIFNYLRKNYNIIISIIIQAAVFGIAHLNIIQSIYTFFLGIALALIYLYTDSILECIIFHIVYNLFGTLIANEIITFSHTLYIIFSIIVLIINIVIILKLLHQNNKGLHQNKFDTSRTKK